MVQIVKRWNIRSWNQRNISLIPNIVGVYVLYNQRRHPLYVGMTLNLKNRLWNHYHFNDIPGIRFFRCYHTRSRRDAIALEKRLFYKLDPMYSD